MFCNHIPMQKVFVDKDIRVFKVYVDLKTDKSIFTACVSLVRRQRTSVHPYPHFSTLLSALSKESIEPGISKYFAALFIYNTITEALNTPIPPPFAHKIRCTDLISGFFNFSFFVFRVMVSVSPCPLQSFRCVVFLCGCCVWLFLVLPCLLMIPISLKRDRLTSLKRDTSFSLVFWMAENADVLLHGLCNQLGERIFVVG
jgi:hypothetical protein